MVGPERSALRLSGPDHPEPSAWRHLRRRPCGVDPWLKRGRSRGDPEGSQSHSAGRRQAQGDDPDPTPHQLTHRPASLPAPPPAGSAAHRRASRWLEAQACLSSLSRGSPASPKSRWPWSRGRRHSPSCWRRPGKESPPTPDWPPSETSVASAWHFWAKTKERCSSKERKDPFTDENPKQRRLSFNTRTTRAAAMKTPTTTSRSSCQVNQRTEG